MLPICARVSPLIAPNLSKMLEIRMFLKQTGRKGKQLSNRSISLRTSILPMKSKVDWLNGS
jgi:hypothetical protein